MKTTHILFLSLAFGLLPFQQTSFGQTPESINYQTVVRDAGGNLITDHLVSFRLSIIMGEPNGLVVYSETHSGMTNQFGLVSLAIGGGTINSGTFHSITWGSSTYFLKTEFDPAGGADYHLMGITQFLSVPYSFSSNKTGGVESYSQDQLDTLTATKGMVVLNTTSSMLNVYTGSHWVNTVGQVVFTINFTDARDGHTYPAIVIGNQTWMAKNLNYDPPTSNDWCFYDSPQNCELYGRLYDWSTIMNGSAGSWNVPSGVQGICPTGWHIPSSGEFDILLDYLGGYLVAGGKMKDISNWASPNTGATNESGFTGIASGGRNNGTYVDLGAGSYLWTTTEVTSTTAIHDHLYYNGAYSYTYEISKANGYSVRCVKD
jgi:uncharacterized protein (TIGR02145 family)